MTAEVNTGHLDRHVTAAQAASTPDSLAHNLKHARNHVAVVSEHQVKLRGALARRVPTAGRELEQLDQAMSSSGGSTRKSGADLDRGLAHDLSNAMIAAGHVDRHLAEAERAGGPASASTRFNLEHAKTHVSEIEHYHSELRKALTERLPAVALELGRLGALTGQGGSAGIPVPVRWPARSGAEADYDVIIAGVGPEPA